jgi:hypothetical protein
MGAADAEFIACRAACIEARLSKQSREAVRPGRLAKMGRVLERARQGIVRKGLEIVREHWDVALFDVAFGSVKAFAIYPALYFAGLGWAIAVAEYGPLNTQAWTAGYLFVRRQILSSLGKRRFGHSLNQLDAFRDEVLSIHPRDARRIHRFVWDGLEWTIRIRPSRLRAAWRRWRGGVPEPNVVTPAELRALVDDDELVFRANPLRGNPQLYEAVLLRRILSDSPARDVLLTRLRPERPRCEEEQELARLLGESLETARARITEQGDALAAELKSKLGSGFSATSLALRWLSWSHQRSLFARLAGLTRLQYGLLAELKEGRPLQRCAGRARVASELEAIEERTERVGRLCEEGMGVASKRAARELTARGIEEARTLGMKARLARAAYAMSGWWNTGASAIDPPERDAR